MKWLSCFSQKSPDNKFSDFHRGVNQGNSTEILGIHTTKNSYKLMNTFCTVRVEFDHFVQLFKLRLKIRPRAFC